MKKRKIDVEWLKKQLLENGKTLTDIGKILGVSRERVRQISEKYGISLKERTAKWYAKYLGCEKLETPEWLLEKKANEKVSLKKLAQELGVSLWIVKAQIKRLGLNPKDFSPEPKEKWVTVSCSFCGKIFKKRFSEIKRNKKYTFCNRKCQGSWLGTNKFRKNLWTPSEDEFVKLNWKKMTDKEMSYYIQRTPNAIFTRRTRVLKLLKRSQKMFRFLKIGGS